MYFLHLLARVIIAVMLCVVFLSDAAKIKKKTPNPYYGHQNAGYEEPEDEKQDLSKVPGEAGVDYPLYHSVPETNFDCSSVPYVPGIYANVETGCQAYHVCHDGREGHQGASFLCSNGTLFNQQEFTCDWWYKVDCKQATSLYRLNAEPETNPFNPKQKTSEEEQDAYKAAPQYYQSTPQYHQSTPQYYKPTPQYYKPTPQYYKPTPQYQPTRQYKIPSQYYKPAPKPINYQPALPQYYNQEGEEY